MDVSSRDEQAFLNRLTAIVGANLNNEQFGVNELAVKIGISRSQVHRKLKAICNQSVSQFISEVRLKKAKELLEKGNLTVSEIAYDVGFGSPSYFIKCFHNKFGYAPGEFMKYAPGNDEEISNIISKPMQSAPKSVNGNSKLKKWLIVLFGVLVIVVSVLYFYKSFIEPGRDKSIAVLPFKNLCEDKNNQHFADGIMDDILTHLSGITDLKVISRTSTERYRTSEKSLPQIAKELGVLYILQGSVQKYGNNVKITIQLNDARMDDHLWAESFIGEQKDIFELESEIAKKVALKVKIVLSPQDIEQIDKVYTENTEAHNLYLRGRFFLHRRGEDNLRLSMNYFNGALEQDSNYSLAYAGLAEAYQALPFCCRYSWKDAYTMSNKYVLKALGIDNSLVQAHATYGAIESSFKTNWKFAEKELLKAIELNPNYADAYQYYAEYLHTTGKLDEAFVNINKAIELDPNSYVKYNIRSNIYQFRGKLKEALKDDEKLLEINKNDSWAYWRNFDIYVQLGEDLKAINELKKFLELDDPGKNFEDQLNHVYADSGINGIYLWCINYFKLKKWVDHFLIAAIYGKISAREQTLENLEKAYEQYEKGQIIMMVKLKTRYEFKFLYGDPRFNALLEKLNLPVD